VIEFFAEKRKSRSFLKSSVFELFQQQQKNGHWAKANILSQNFADSQKAFPYSLFFHKISSKKNNVNLNRKFFFLIFFFCPVSSSQKWTFLFQKPTAPTF